MRHVLVMIWASLVIPAWCLPLRHDDFLSWLYYYCYYYYYNCNCYYNSLWQARKIWQCCMLFYISEVIHFQNFKLLLDSFDETQVKESFLITTHWRNKFHAKEYIAPQNSTLYYEYSLIQNLWTTGSFLENLQPSTPLKKKFHMNFLILDTLQSVVLSYSVKIK